VNHRTLGKTGWQVTELSLGCATHVLRWSEEEERNFIATVHRALELGVNFFDTSDSYRTEGWPAKALGGRRQDVYVATKVGKYAEWTRAPLSYAVPEHVHLCCDGSCPWTWCRSGTAGILVAGRAAVAHASAAGSMRVRSSRKGAMVSRVM
jgi:aryl-alcohol dehydrogenase-like predicted oxidoreductase